MNYPFIIEMTSITVICAIPATILALATIAPEQDCPRNVAKLTAIFTLVLVFIVLIATNLSKVIAY